MKQFRIRVHAVVTREQIVGELTGSWRRLLPRFKPLVITLIAFDGNRSDAMALSSALKEVGVAHVVFVTVDGVKV